MNDTDLQLLQSYARNNSQDSFATLVNRHLNLVFSAALRQVRSPQLAEEVAQSVFADLAQSATNLKPDTILPAWLYEVTRRTAIDVVRRESRRQLREKVAHELTAMNATADDWTHIEPFLDEAMHALDETDRAAVLLRYFENKTLREVGETLGTSDDAAQKRVSRAVERLREFFTKRGVTIGASGLVIIISANAVQAAPVGMATIISTAAMLAGTTVAAATTATVTKTIVMTTLQKTIVATTVIAAVGMGIFEAREASILRIQIQKLRQERTPLAAQLRQLQRERDDAANRLAAMAEEIAELKSGQKTSELLKLRGDVGVLRQRLASSETNSPGSGLARMMRDPALKEFNRQVILKGIKSRYAALFEELKLNPEQTEEFAQLFSNLYMKFGEIAEASSQGGVYDTSEIERASLAAKAEFGKQLLPLLGESGNARFMEFSQEIPARATVQLLNDQLGGNPLDSEQISRLFQVVKAEPYELTHGIEGDLNKVFLSSQDQIDDYLQRLAASNHRVLQNASTFLAPDQLSALNTVLSNGVNARTSQGAVFGKRR